MRRLGERLRDRAPGRESGRARMNARQREVRATGTPAWSTRSLSVESGRDSPAALHPVGGRARESAAARTTATTNSSRNGECHSTHRSAVRGTAASAGAHGSLCLEGRRRARHAAAPGREARVATGRSARRIGHEPSTVAARGRRSVAGTMGKGFLPVVLGTCAQRKARMCIAPRTPAPNPAREQQIVRLSRTVASARAAEIAAKDHEPEGPCSRRSYVAGRPAREEPGTRRGCDQQEAPDLCGF